MNAKNAHYVQSSICKKFPKQVSVTSLKLKYDQTKKQSSVDHTIFMFKWYWGLIDKWVWPRCTRCILAEKDQCSPIWFYRRGCKQSAFNTELNLLARLFKIIKIDWLTDRLQWPNKKLFEARHATNEPGHGRAEPRCQHTVLLIYSVLFIALWLCTICSWFFFSSEL